MKDLADFQQYDVVEIVEISDLCGFATDSFSTREPRIGDRATIVEVYSDPEGFELECSDPKTGITIWLHAFKAGALKVKGINSQ